MLAGHDASPLRREFAQQILRSAWDEIFGFPQLEFSADLAIIKKHRGYLLVHPGTDASARSVVFPGHAALGLRKGFPFTIANMSGAGALSVSMLVDTLRMPGGSLTGTRTVAANSLATLIYVTGSEWMITGPGVT